MEQAAPCCFCWLAAAVWALGHNDRFCSLCSRRLASVAPLAPVLPSDPDVPVLVLYLREHEPGQLAGCLEFQLGGQAEHFTPTWQSLNDPVSSMSRWERPTRDVLVLHVESDARAARPTGEIGRARVELKLPADHFVFEVCLYALGTLHPRAWLSRRSNGPVSAGWVIYRDAPDGVLFLNCELGAGIPVQIERVDCRHEAVTARVVADTAGPLSCARVHWNVARLRRDVEQDRVPFRIHLRGLEPIDVEPLIRWRRSQALRCYPAGLTVPLLTAGQDQEHPVQFTNADDLDLLVDRIESSVFWIESVPPAGRSLFLRPGESSDFRLRLRTGKMAAGPGPHLGTVTFHFKGLGKQAYDVCIEHVRTPCQLAGPLFVDPGPPRVVIAYSNPDSGELTYLPGVGTIGRTPEAIDLSPAEYVRAVYRGEGTAPLLTRLVATARALAANRSGVLASEVCLLGRPWVPTTLALPGVRRVDVLDLCRRSIVSASGLPPDTVVLLLEAWAVWTLPPSKPPHRSQGLTNTLGVGVVRCLLRQIRRLGQHRSLPRSDAVQLSWIETSDPVVPDHVAWLQQSCDSLLADYVWGPGHAWDALFAAVWEHLPSTRACSFDRTLAGADFQCELDACLQHLARMVGQRPCALVSPLFSQEMIGRIVQSEARRGFPSTVHSAPWLEWAGQDPHLVR